VTTARPWWLAVLVTGLVSCASPEAARVRGGGPGADPGNHDLVAELHDRRRRERVREAAKR